MSRGRWYVVVSYDVSDDARRRRVAKVLAAFGERVQYSVFDCLLTDKRLMELDDRIRKVIDESQDSVRFYKLCSACERRMRVRGRGTVQEDEPVVVV